MQVELDEAAVSQLVSKALSGNSSVDTDAGSGLVGENVFIRTVTFHFTGKLVKENENYLFLENAAWIADSGRFSTALKTGSLSEVEPYPDGEIIPIAVGAIVDLCPWRHELPRTQK